LYDNDKTAILVFSRFAVEEARVKKYAHAVGKKSGNQLAGHLIQHTLNQAKSSGLPVYTFFPDKQKGISFGERLSNAIEEVFAQGINNVIISGTDAPSISSSLFQRVAKKLIVEDLVLGPAKDGGVYLIGINKQAYNRQHFVEIPWLSNAVFHSFITYADNFELRFSSEQPGEDIDSVTALFQWKKNNTTHSFSLLFQLLFEAYQKAIAEIHYFLHLQNALRFTTYLRGPPSFL